MMAELDTAQTSQKPLTPIEELQQKYAAYKARNIGLVRDVPRHPYTRVQIQEYLDKYFQNHHTGDQGKRINRIIGDFIYNSPGWVQLTIISNGLKLEIGRIKDVLDPYSRSGNKDRRGLSTAYGDYSRHDKKVRSRSFHRKTGKKQEARIKWVVAHEIGHAIDNYLGEFQSIDAMGHSSSAFYSESNPVDDIATTKAQRYELSWKHALDRELGLRHHRKRHFDGQRGIPNHLHIRYHKRSDRGKLYRQRYPGIRFPKGSYIFPYSKASYPCEAMAEMTSYYLLINDKLTSEQANKLDTDPTFAERETDRLLSKDYPILWNNYRDVMMPQALEMAAAIHHDGMNIEQKILHKQTARLRSNIDGICEKYGYEACSNEDIFKAIDNGAEMVLSGLLNVLAFAIEGKMDALSTLNHMYWMLINDRRVIKSIFDNNSEIKERAEEFVQSIPSTLKERGVKGLINQMLVLDSWMMEGLERYYMQRDCPERLIDTVDAHFEEVSEAKKPTITEIEKRIQKAWSAQTSSDGERWSRQNSAWGQCAVSALYFQEVQGGDLVRVEYETPDGLKGSHYFNILEDVLAIDTTLEQFPEGTTFKPALDEDFAVLVEKTKEYVKSKGFDGSVRDYILSYEPTKERYEKLKTSIEQDSGKIR